MKDTKTRLEEIIEAEYKVYGFDGRAEVKVNESSQITIYLNHEEPYMGNKFWEFLRTLQEKLGDEYEKKDCEFFCSYYIMRYEKK